MKDMGRQERKYALVEQDFSQEIHPGSCSISFRRPVFFFAALEVRGAGSERM
jgi:hypothetical protein